jgi:hypothetical protein
MLVKPDALEKKEKGLNLVDKVQNLERIKIKLNKWIKKRKNKALLKVKQKTIKIE